MNKELTAQGEAPADGGKLDLDWTHIEERVAAHYYAHGLTPAEHERLSMLVEEAAEVAQIGAKILRFGYASRHPDGGPCNRDLLVGEIQDVLACICLMNRPDLELRFESVNAPRSKIDRKLQYSSHQGQQQ